MKRHDLANNAKFLKLLIYGKPGAGKTTLAGSAALDPRTSPVLWLNAAGNPESLAGQTTKPDVFNLEVPEDLNAAYNYLATGQRATDRFVGMIGEHKVYKTLVLDGITDFQRGVFDVVLGLTAGDMANKIGSIPPKAEWGHYGSVLRQMLRMAGMIFKLPMNVIYTALEAEDRYDPDTKLMLDPVRPSLQGQSATLVPSYALGVYRVANIFEAEPNVLAELKREQREAKFNVLQLTPSRKVYAKNQHVMTTKPRYLPDPRIAKLLDLLLEGAPIES